VKECAKLVLTSKETLLCRSRHFCKAFSSFTGFL
jgi:hypothetical protein